MAIIVLLLWLGTAAAGLTLLRAGGEARRARAGASRAAGQQAALVPSGPASSAALPLRPDGTPPLGPHTRVQTPPGEHPLLEFSHPALAVSGMAVWLMFVLVHYRPLAWIALCILLVTIGLGLGWLGRGRRDSRTGAAGAWEFPRRLVLLHGLTAALSIVLTVLTAVTASHG